MRKRILLIFFIGVIVGISGNNAVAQKKSPQTRRVRQNQLSKPTIKESLKVLFANGDIPLATGKYCKSMNTGGDKTVFDYLSGILAAQAEPKTKNSLEYKVSLIRRQNSRFWQIHLSFISLDEESGDPWDNGFRFLMRTRNRQMLRGSLMCIGTG